MVIESLLFPILFLCCSTILLILSKALKKLGRINFKKELNHNRDKFFFYVFLKKLFPSDSWNNFLIVNGSTRQISRILYTTTFILYFLSHPFFSGVVSKETKSIQLDLKMFLLIVAVIVILSLLLDFLAIFIGNYYPKKSLSIFFPIGSIFLFCLSPVTFLILKLQKLLLPSEQQINKETSYKIKDKILELVVESDLNHELSLQDKKLIISVASFKDRIAREIMVPRIDMFMLSSSCLIEQAAQAFVQEGYSRVPVYKNSMDNIIGVLLYKDLLNFYVESEKTKSSQISHLTVESLLKPVVYTPETKKISILLQELKAKQIHLAIVVDEYGGTEGIVTIEDILEELVGEIGDEYDDIKQDSLYSEHPQGGWIVDAKMNIIDIEKELTISIPHSPEYDTIGGYIFHRSGSIPTKGWKIHHENFDLEILKSSDRSVEKVRITPSINEEI